ncbi:MAG: aspartate/glutamate racemase family protein [Pseudomonadota bacterium]
MTVRIWHQSGAPFAALAGYGERLAQHVQEVVSVGTEVVFHGIDATAYGGHAPAEVLKYAYARHLILGRIIENCIQAEREGFDAVAIASYSDPFVREARSMVAIPVVSMAESSMLLACGAARRFALVTLTPENVWRLREMVERHGLEKRVSGIYPLQPRTTERDLVQAFADPSGVVGIFESAVRLAVADGAELVIPAEGVLNELLYSIRYQGLGETPVLDCVGATFLHAELMVRMQRTSGLRVGRAWDHARPDAAMASVLRRSAGLE